MRLADLNAECAAAIRDHHATGHFTYDEAIMRLTALGFSDTETADRLSRCGHGVDWRLTCRRCTPR